VSDAVAAEIRALRRDHPRWSYKLIHDKLVVIAREKPALQPLPGYASVCRYMKHHGLALRVSSSSLELPSTNKMTCSVMRADPFVESEVERGAAVDLTLGPDAASMAANDALHGFQTDADACELARGMQSLTDSEELRSIGHVEAGSVVSRTKNTVCPSSSVEPIHCAVESRTEAASTATNPSLRGSFAAARRV
jgi:hypothetical protein